MARVNDWLKGAFICSVASACNGSAPSSQSPTVGDAVYRVQGIEQTIRGPAGEPYATVGNRPFVASSPDPLQSPPAEPAAGATSNTAKEVRRRPTPARRKKKQDCHRFHFPPDFPIRKLDPECFQ